MEVLVAIIVLSFGMLGLAGLQATSLKVSREAGLQAAAVQLAREYGELMRDNPRVAGRATAAGNPYLVAATNTTAGAPARNCRTGPCNATDLAAWQAHEWQSRLFAALPSARLAVCRDAQPHDGQGLPQWPCTGAGGGGNVAIKIGWRRASTRAADAPSGEARFQEAGERPAIVHVVLPGGATP